MGDVRLNPITGEEIIVSTTRADRPGAWSSDPTSEDPVVCPFCPEHESETPPEIERLGGEAWTARVVPNKYPAIEDQSQPAHEVVIDARAHDVSFDEMSLEEVTRAVALWRDRAVAQASVQSRRYVCVFRNEGRGSGQSIPHPHSQVLALDFVPPRIKRELYGFLSKECPLCELASAEARTGDGLVIDRCDGAVVLASPAARVPLEMWITSVIHQSDWTDIEPAGLAQGLLSATRRLRALHPGAPFNIGIVSAPLRTAGRERFHWYAEVTPRLTNLAGYELFSGSSINIEAPERAAERLRDVVQAGLK